MPKDIDDDYFYGTGTINEHFEDFQVYEKNGELHLHDTRTDDVAKLTENGELSTSTLQAEKTLYVEQGSVPEEPPSGTHALFADDDGALQKISPDGTVEGLAGSLSLPRSEADWTIFREDGTFKAQNVDTASVEYEDAELHNVAPQVTAELEAVGGGTIELQGQGVWDVQMGHDTQRDDGRSMHVAIPLASNVHLQGPGERLKLRLIDNHPTDIDGSDVGGIIGNNASNQSGIVLRDLHIDGNRANQDLSSISNPNQWEGIDLDGAEGTHIQNVRVENAISDGIDFDRSHRTTTVGCTAINNGGYGFHSTSNSRSMVFVGLRTEDNGDRRGAAGIDLDGVGDLLVGLTSIGDRTGVEARNDSTLVTGATVKNPVSSGIKLYGVGVVVSGNTVVGAGNEGLGTGGGASSSLFVNNTVRNCGGAGIRFDGGDITVANNVVRGNERGIYPDLDSGQHGTVRGNLVQENNGGRNVGMSFSSGELLIQNNEFIGHDIAGLEDGDVSGELIGNHFRNNATPLHSDFSIDYRRDNIGLSDILDSRPTDPKAGYEILRDDSGTVVREYYDGSSWHTL